MSNFQKHHKTEGTKDDWLTPPEIIKELGPFDLDPCCPGDMPWKTANEMYSRPVLIGHCGLEKSWHGRIWLNPPYSTVAKWVKKLAEHGNGIALIFARTETKFFQEYVFGKANAILFVKGRLNFYHINGERGKQNAGAPSVLIAYGFENAKILEASNIPGYFSRIK